MTPVDPIPGLPSLRLGEGQPQYAVLPAIRCDGSEGHTITRWRPSDEDRARIAAGGDIFVSVLTFGYPIQPLIVDTEPPVVQVLHPDGIREYHG